MHVEKGLRMWIKEEELSELKAECGGLFREEKASDGRRRERLSIQSLTISRACSVEVWKSFSL